MQPLRFIDTQKLKVTKVSPNVSPKVSSKVSFKVSPKMSLNEQCVPQEYETSVYCCENRDCDYYDTNFCDYPDTYSKECDICCVNSIVESALMIRECREKDSLAPNYTKCIIYEDEDEYAPFNINQEVLYHISTFACVECKNKEIATTRQKYSEWLNNL